MKIIKKIKSLIKENRKKKWNRIIFYIFSCTESKWFWKLSVMLGLDNKRIKNVNFLKFHRNQCIVSYKQLKIIKIAA